MRRFLLIAMLALALPSPFVLADDVTDAILGVDPRLKLQTGQGSALGSTYGRQDGEEEPSEDLNKPLDESDAANANAPYAGLRSPLFDSSATNENTDEDSLPEEHLSLPDTPPLGKPDAREGVWYSDDLNR